MDLRRLAVVALVSIPIAVEVVVGEVLFVGHIIFLVEVLGFAWGLVAFTLIWAVLGVTVLAVADLLWPRMRAQIGLWVGAVTESLGAVLERIEMRAALAVFGIGGVLIGVGVTVTLAGGEIWGWLTEHRSGVATFVVVGAVVFTVLLVVAQLGRRFERWVRGIADTAGPATRWLAVLLAIVILGPALGWPLFRILGYSGRSVYILTVAGAPLFGAVWVPIYTFGLWGAINGLL